jgi:hypothetical protein
MNNKELIIAELKRIASEHNGVLMPADVVEAARPKDSVLHSRFEWNDSEAAEKYRLWQARYLLNVTVEYIGSEKEGSDYRVFVSLTPDRADGGYRSIDAVMRNRGSREQLLADALEELDRIQVKYSQLKELAEIFRAIKRVRRQRINPVRKARRMTAQAR